jgi:2-methylisocitrate lyase-like PEP mutase family enzyme
VAEAVAVIRERIDIPMIVDMDTGFGNSLNVQRTVEVLERSGASALQMEDQVSPKRCGHMAGKEVVVPAEMVGKIKAFVDARRQEQTLLVARTDALAVEGLESAMERAELYLEAGADLLFIEAPQTLEQMQLIGARFGGRVPLVHNLVEGGHSPVDSVAEIEPLGYRVALFPVALLHQFVPGARALLEHIYRQGETAGFKGEMIDLQEMNRLLGADELLAGNQLPGPAGRLAQLWRLAGRRTLLAGRPDHPGQRAPAGAGLGIPLR